MAQRLPPSVIRPPQGGRLVTTLSSENVGPNNYVEKTNFRREQDREVRREGTLDFHPLDELPLGSQHLNIEDEVIGLWEAVRPNGERTLVAATATDLYRLNQTTGAWDTIGSGFSATSWHGESLDGYLVLNNGVDLPVYFRVEDSVVNQLKELRDNGVASARVMTVYHGFLLFADVTEIQSDEMADWMNGPTPYGIVPENICNRVRYRVTWSDYGQPTNYSPAITGVIESATKNQITLEYPVSFLVAGETRVAVTNAGPNGGILGGQEETPDGVLVTAVDGTTITLEVEADADATYPLTVQVTRWADTSSFVGYSDIQDDSSAIIAMKPLKGLLYVFRETGIFSGRYTAQVETPFVFSPEHPGQVVPVPHYPEAIAVVDGEYFVYPTQNRFYRFDGVGQPVIYPPLDNCRTLFFDSATATAFCRHNPISKEIWFFTGDGVLALDHVQDTASWIDEPYSAACYAKVGDEYWFVMAVEASYAVDDAVVPKWDLVQYGLTDSGVITYLRRGEAAPMILKWGLNSANDDFNEKDILTLTVILASRSGRTPAVVRLWGTDHPAVEPELLMAYEAALPDESVIEMFYRNVYFQDSLEFTGEDELRVEFSGRVIVFTRINSRGHIAAA